MSTLKTQDGKSVSDLFAQDILQHFSGSAGDRVSLECASDLNCTVTVLILYGHHGAENGLSQSASYKLTLARENNKIMVKAVNYSVSEVN